MTDNTNLIGGRARSFSAAYSPDGRTLAVGSRIGTALWRPDAYHWDAEKRERVKKEFLALAEQAKTDPQIPDDSSREYIIGELLGSVRRNLYYQVKRHDFSRALCMDFSPDGKILAIGRGFFGGIGLINAHTGMVKWETSGYRNKVRFVDFSPDGKTLVSGSLDRTVRFWDAETGAAIRDLKGHKGMAYAGAYSPDGKTLAVASSKTLAVWDAETDALLHTLEGHGGAVFCLAFSPDGAEIATGGRDKTVRRWSAKTGELIKTLEKHAAPVTAVVYSPDGADLLSGDAEGKIRRWSLND